MRSTFCNIPLTPPGGVCYYGNMKNTNQLINNIIGQLEGVKKMIKADKDCEAVLIQLKAAKSALDTATARYLEEHLDYCLKRGKKQKIKRLVAELTKIK